MAGIRLRHPTHRSCTMTVVDADRPYPEPFECPACGHLHEVKTYHLKLDANGEVEVSQVVYERLRTLRGLPFRTVGSERRPRPQVVVVNGPVVRPVTFAAEQKGV